MISHAVYALQATAPAFSLPRWQRANGTCSALNGSGSTGSTLHSQRGVRSTTSTQATAIAPPNVAQPIPRSMGITIRRARTPWAAGLGVGHDAPPVDTVRCGKWRLPTAGRCAYGGLWGQYTLALGLPSFGPAAPAAWGCLDTRPRLG
jgi:hypothetical protein